MFDGNTLCLLFYSSPKGAATGRASTIKPLQSQHTSSNSCCSMQLLSHVWPYPNLKTSLFIRMFKNMHFMHAYFDKGPPFWAADRRCDWSLKWLTLSQRPQSGSETEIENILRTSSEKLFSKTYYSMRLEFFELVKKLDESIRTCKKLKVFQGERGK